jgi:YHS domain-containing protein
MVRDPVCNMTVDQTKTQFISDHKGQEYYFCSKACKIKFENDPSQYIKQKGVLARFLDWIARGNERSYHGHAPDCCKH